MNLRERCERLYQSLIGHMATPELEDADVNAIEAFAREIRNETLEEAAIMAFEKVRCDDRTDRWQVANEVAAHIRHLSQISEGLCM